MSDWKTFVQEKYRELKKINPSAKLGDAMKKASKEWKDMKNGTMMAMSKSRKQMRRSKKARKSRKMRR